MPSLIERFMNEPILPGAVDARCLEQSRDRSLAFVLSAGRAGTMFLTKLINDAYPEARCMHEPPPSRAMLMVGNVRNHLGLGGRACRYLFARGLVQRLEGLRPEQPYVEINPMLCPVTDLVGGLPAKLHVLHVVRDPRTWATSIRTFKASGYRRHLIDYTPYANPAPAPRPKGWLELPRIERALWQWRECNERIEATMDRASSFERIRYEDVFSFDPQTSRVTVEKALRSLGLDPAPGLDAWSPTERVNAKPDRRQGIEPPAESTVQRICGPLLAKYGYERTESASPRPANSDSHQGHR